ncbi:TPA: hypothetical protein R4C66_002075 [Salmonella enterica subsp. enterica serovar Poona]|nr:hypothetical protein [Salmonella enterica subsp. enterica serovar Poona]
MKALLKILSIQISLIILSIIIPPAIQTSAKWINYHLFFSDKESIAGEKDPTLLSHRMISFDKENNIITSETAALAYGNTLEYLHSVREKCDANLKTTNFLECANNILGDNFYYHQSPMVSLAWANHYSDCDLNVYLLMDALKQAGKNSSIVYAPGHAFLAFTDGSNNSFQFWETTHRHNHGEVSDMKNPELYKSTPNTFYYTPMTQDFAEHLYPALVLDYIDDKIRGFLLEKLRRELPDNPLLTDYWYAYAVEKLTIDDIKNLSELLKSDPTSIDKKLTLSRYWLTHDNPEKARMYLNQIDNNDCDTGCLYMKNRAGIKNKIILYTDIMFTKSGISLTPSERQSSIGLSILFYLAFNFILFVRYIRKHETKSKKTPTKKTE